MNKTQKNNKDFYNKNADIWAENKTNSFFHEKQFRIFRKLVSKNARVLDIGCAWGIHLPLFSGIGHGIQYEGFDISQSMIKIAKSRWPKHKFYIGDITDEKMLPNKKYDALWAAAVLMHVPDKDWSILFKNLKSLLRPKGYIYFTIPSERIQKWAEKDPRHFSYMPKNVVLDFIDSQKMKIIRSGSISAKDVNNRWNWFIIQL